MPQSLIEELREMAQREREAKKAKYQELRSLGLPSIEARKALEWGKVRYDALVAELKTSAVYLRLYEQYHILLEMGLSANDASIASKCSPEKFALLVTELKARG